VFSTHNLIRDPPFSRIDLISCRNLLIYFGAEFQARVMPVFHYALKPQGFLFLGTSENIGHSEDLFEPVDKKQRIFMRRDARRRRPDAGRPSRRRAARPACRSCARTGVAKRSSCAARWRRGWSVAMRRPMW
jgi:two-component system, chemotaxis family, CheB/CheR fusion protein